MTGSILELEDVSRRYGELRAVDGVSLALRAGVRHALIGPNGAGKTTLFNLVSGVVRPSSGRIRFGGVDVTRKREQRRTRLGMGRTFQRSTLFDALSAFENVALAVQRHLGHAHDLLRPARRFRDVNERSLELLALVGLDEHARRLAGTLSHGHRRQLEVALALATEPQLLLLDEPTAGMSRDEANRFLRIVTALPPSLTVLLVEHDMDVVFGVASVVFVLDAGRLIASGSPDEIRRSSVVQEAYLGPGERLEELFER